MQPLGHFRTYFSKLDFDTFSQTLIFKTVSQIKPVEKSSESNQKLARDTIESFDNLGPKLIDVEPSIRKKNVFQRDKICSFPLFYREKY